MTLKPLWPHQVEALECIERDIRLHRSVLLVMATGTGKTRVFVEVIRRHLEAYPRGRVLVIAHRSELLAQAHATMAEFGLSVELEKAQERASRGFALVKSQVVVGSVQSMRDQRLKTWPTSEFTMVVVDESHHAVSRTYLDVLAHFASAKILGVTATADRGDGVGLRAAFDATAYEYPIRKAIAAGVLCPVRQIAVHCADLDLSRVRATAGRLSDADIERAMGMDAVLHQVAGPLAKLAGDRPTIVFTATVATAHDLAGVLGLEVGHDQVVVVDGKMAKDDRAEVLRRYSSGEAQYIVNVGVLTEGYDHPPTSCIAMARPTLSRGLYTQMAGRGTRVSEGKEDCLIIDFVGNSGRHSLVRMADALAGKDVPDYIRSAIDKALTDGDDIEEAVEKAEEGQRARLESIRIEREARRVRADVEYEAMVTDPFKRWTGKISLPSRPRHAPSVSEKQAKLLERYGFPTDIDRKLASKIIDEMFATKWEPVKLREVQVRYAKKPE